MPSPLVLTTTTTCGLFCDPYRMLALMPYRVHCFFFVAFFSAEPGSCLLRLRLRVAVPQKTKASRSRPTPSGPPTARRGHWRRQVAKRCPRACQLRINDVAGPQDTPKSEMRLGKGSVPFCGLLRGALPGIHAEAVRHRDTKKGAARPAGHGRQASAATCHSFDVFRACPACPPAPIFSFSPHDQVSRDDAQPAW